MSQSHLFSSPDFRPLAARMRPTTLDDYVGQRHFLGEDKPLAKSLRHGKSHSMILWGPPGSGKTTLAEIIAYHCNAHVERISAVTGGVKDIRDAVANAQTVAAQEGKQTLLFVDEVHRFNKAQQDAFLPYVEDGTLLFIGATTENPSFELNRALLSRARVYQLRPLDSEELEQILDAALADKDKGLGQHQLNIDDDIKGKLVDAAAGDARRLLNTLEICVDFAEDGQINLAVLKTALGDKVAAQDKGGDIFYDLISAFHKSVRGSSPDAALYWYARMLVAGTEPLYVARRLLAIASEDIGNADPRALQVTLNAWDIFHRVGPAEGERAIAQAAVYCACAPKSNAVYTAFKQALRDAKALADYEVPHHIRNAPTDLMKELGYGQEYQYAHDFPGAYVPGESYLPQELATTTYYQPTERGLEKKIAEKLDYLKRLDEGSEWQRYE